MDTAVFRSLDELTILAPAYVVAFAAIVVGFALVLEDIAGARRRKPVAGRRPSLHKVAADPDPRMIKSCCRQYSILNRLGGGDVADVYSAAANGHDLVLKIARSSRAGAHLLAEAQWLTTLANSGGRSYRDYFPRLVESFRDRVGGHRRQVNVLEHRRGYFMLDEVRRRYPNGLDARHLAWVFKRMLAGIGFANSCGFVHGAVLPPHVMVHAENHGLQLIDWIHAAPIGRGLHFVPATYRDWYPREALEGKPAGAATDIYLAAKCVIHLAGGDPIAERWAPGVPEPMRRFVSTCLYPAARMRPQDAWKLHEEFDELLLRLFGPPQYHRLVMA